MKQDLELIRKILFKLEDEQSLGKYIRGSALNIPDASSDSIIYQLLLLKDAGYIVAKDLSSDNRIDLLVSRMTWAGHEFLEAARDDTRWQKTKTAALKTGSFIMDVVKPVLVDLAADTLRKTVGLA